MDGSEQEPTTWRDQVQRRAAVIAARFAADELVRSGVLDISGPPEALVLSGTFVVAEDAPLERMLPRLTGAVVSEVEDAVGIVFANTRIDVVVEQRAVPGQHDPVIELPELALAGAGAVSNVSAAPLAGAAALAGAGIAALARAAGGAPAHPDEDAVA